MRERYTNAAMPKASGCGPEETAAALKGYLSSRPHEDRELLALLTELPAASQAALYRLLTEMLKTWAGMPVRNDPTGPVVDASRKICDLMGWRH